MAQYVEPARKSYFFDKGYKDLANTIKGAWSRNWMSVKGYGRRIANLRDSSLGGKIFFGLIYILAMIAVFVCGSAITAVISAINIIILVVFMSIVYVGFSIVWLIDRLYLERNKIFTACGFCKQKSLIPVYLCPKCHARHEHLTPGVYGILKRTCNCGYKLPTTFFNGRKNLEAICPNCGHSLNNRESRPLCIPVVGGRSVGKTAFITAFSKNFIEEIAPANGLQTEIYDRDSQNIYRDILTDYAAGSTRQTVRQMDLSKPSSISFSFFVQHPSLTPERLFHIYDIAGEVFTDNAENEVQQQYEYSQGIVLLIDPFAIPSINYKYGELLQPNDIAGIGKADINGIMDAFLNKLREVTGLSDSKMSAVPLAVVINKIDSAGLDQDVGVWAVSHLMQKEPGKYACFGDAQDYLCRKFLRENNMGNFLSSIEAEFKTNRFFACSAIGHTRDKGEYRPQGVMAPMEWLIRTADPKMGSLWKVHSSSQKTN